MDGVGNRVGGGRMWYVPAHGAGRADALAGVFFDENFGHFMSARMGGTGEAARPFYFIVMRLLGGTLPLTFMLPALTLAFVQRAFALPIRRAMLYQLALALAVVLLFSVASAKRDDYILPAIPPLAVLFAALFTGAIVAAKGAVPDGAEPRATHVPIVRDLTALAIAVTMLAGVAAIICFVRIGGSLDTFGARLQSGDASFATFFLTGMTHLQPPFVAFATAVVIGATVTILGFTRGTPVRTGTGIAILCLAGSMLWTGVLRPQAAHTRTLRPFAAAVKARVGTAPLYLGFMDPEFAWYYGGAVPAVPRAIAKSGPDANATIYLVARPSELGRLTPPVRRALILVLPSSVLGGNPPSLYLLASPASPESTSATGRRRLHMTLSVVR